MGRFMNSRPTLSQSKTKTAAARKSIDVMESSDEENLASVRRTSRSKRDSTPSNSQQTSRKKPGRPSRNSLNSVANGKQNERDGKRAKSVSSSNSSKPDSEDETPVVNRKRGRPSHSSVANNKPNERNGKRAKTKSISNSSESDFEVEVPIVNRKRDAKSDKTPARASRSTRNSEVNGKRNEEKGKGTKTLSVSSSSEDDLSEDEAPISNLKRQATSEDKGAKNQKPSTSATPSKKNKSSDGQTNKPGRPSKKNKNNKADEESYEVEKILDHKFEDDVKYFLIRWKGYDSDVDSWERQKNISCPALVAQYYEEHPEASVSAKRNKKKRKPAIPKPRTLKIDEQLNYDSDWDENEDYDVERILDVCVHRDSKREFLIRWRGYSSKSDTWEPEENLDCKELIEKFMEKVDQLKNLSQKDLRPVRSQTQRFTLMTQASARRLSKRNVGKQRAVYYDCDE